MLQPKKPVVKKTTKKTKSASEKIGNITLRDVKNAGEDALQIATLGGYGKMKKSLGSEYKHKKIGEKKYGGKVTKAKNGKSFPDLNKDGKVTKADILKGRGVIAKNGKPVEKAFLGKMLGGVGKSVLGGLAGKAIGGLMGGGGKGGMLGGLLGKDGKTIKKSKSGRSMKKCRYGCK